jgi:hypothetical protein
LLTCRSPATGKGSLAPPGMSLGVINGVEVNVAEGVQYIQRIQNTLQERRSFLRDVAGTRTWARWLAWTGFLLAVAGFGPSSCSS